MVNLDDKYIRIGAHKFTLAELAKQLGIPEDDDIAIGQVVPAGVLEATTQSSSADFPCVDIELHSKDSYPIGIAMVEQPLDEKQPRLYLFSRGDSYIGYMDVDVRPDAKVQEDLHDAIIHMSGDPGQMAIAILDGPYSMAIQGE